MTMDANGQFILDWTRRMIAATGLCAAALVEALWRANGKTETADRNPPPEAVLLAQQWEDNPHLAAEYIAESVHWCMRPGGGCGIGTPERCKHIGNPMGIRKEAAK